MKIEQTDFNFDVKSPIVSKRHNELSSVEHFLKNNIF